MTIYGMTAFALSGHVHGREIVGVAQRKIFGANRLDGWVVLANGQAPVAGPAPFHDREPFSIRLLICSIRHAEIRGPSLTAGGKRPDLIPLHQVDLETGMMAGIGGLAFESPMIWLRRR
jgi:hypothetical protein